MWWPNRIKSQPKIITLDWPAKCAAERTREEDAYLSGKHDLKCVHFSANSLILAPPQNFSYKSDRIYRRSSKEQRKRYFRGSLKLNYFESF